ncbi:MAG: hypothetical protein KatS3mg059_0906 [Thermomicrobiales bacterium]|nr:MAG: hypothetical protein KatS3mg059_0906 [Thermomicrobiales bacterium]
MATRYPEKETALDWIEQNQSRLSDFHMQIWHYHEPAWREYKSARAYCDLLRAEGFEVEEGSGGMPTAFVARWGEGKPVIGSYAEYDAVPGNSQQPVPYPAPREGVHPWAAGHTDPHSMLGVGALAGILGAKAAMERHGLKGTLVFFGEPAEKVCGLSRFTRPRATTMASMPFSRTTPSTPTPPFGRRTAVRTGAPSSPSNAHTQSSGWAIRCHPAGRQRARRRRTSPPACPARSTR